MPGSQKKVDVSDYVDCIPVAFAVFDPAYQMVVANADSRLLFGAFGAALASGTSIETAVDRGFRSVISAVERDTVDADLESIARAVSAAEPFDLRMPDDRIVSVSVTRHPTGRVVASGRDVTDLRLGQSAGVQADAVIRGSGAARSMVLSAFAERIRTPIAQLSRTARALRDQAEPWARDPQIEAMMAHCRTLAAIAQDASVLAGDAIEALQVLPTEGGFRAKVSRVVDVYASAAHGRGSRIDVAFGDGVPDRVLFDPIRLRQCLSTLLAFAVDRTLDGVISVGVSGEVAHDGNLVLMVEVRDTGTSLSDDEIGALFTPQSSKSARSDGDTDTEPGVKLPSLALVYTLAALMGGDLTARSTTNGLSLCLSLRSIQLDGEATEAAPIKALPPTKRPASQASPNTMRDRRILVLEPDDDRLMDVQHRLSATGAVVFDACDGLQARRLTYAHKPHMFLVDPRRFKLDRADLKTWLARHDFTLVRLSVPPAQSHQATSKPDPLFAVSHVERLLDLSDIGRLLTIYRFETRTAHPDFRRARRA